MMGVLKGMLASEFQTYSKKEIGSSLSPKTQTTKIRYVIFKSTWLTFADNVFKILFTEAELALLEHDFQAIKEEARGTIHPKLAKRLRLIFDAIHKAGGEVHSERVAKKRRTTWSDSTPTTMYLS